MSETFIRESLNHLLNRFVQNRTSSSNEKVRSMSESWIIDSIDLFKIVIHPVVKQVKVLSESFHLVIREICSKQWFNQYETSDVFIIESLNHSRDLFCTVIHPVMKQVRFLSESLNYLYKRFVQKHALTSNETSEVFMNESLNHVFIQ